MRSIFPRVDDTKVWQKISKVSLSEEAYERLKRAKKESESLSDVITRAAKAPSGSLDRFIGAWKEESVEEIEAKITADRRASGGRDARFTR
ncbi:MAG: antitoxin VapB family protein [Nitrososphaerota archaeon]|nr:antitoxin VapB family protein [Nitrososphaerota archaeon]